MLLDAAHIGVNKRKRQIKRINPWRRSLPATASLAFRLLWLLTDAGGLNWTWSWELKWTELDPLDGRASRERSSNFPGRADALAFHEVKHSYFLTVWMSLKYIWAKQKQKEKVSGGTVFLTVFTTPSANRKAQDEDRSHNQLRRFQVISKQPPMQQESSLLSLC